MIFSGIAGGTIAPTVFVIASTTEDNKFLQATANSKIVGVAQKGTRRFPGLGIDDGNAALAGENILIYGPPDTCGIQLGGTVAAGDYLEATTGGVAITCSTDGHFYGGIALQAGVTGQVIEMQVQLGMRGA